MIALANSVIVPFFARIPPRATGVVQRAIERIRRQELGSQATEFSYNLFCTELREVGVDGPTFDEFAAWARDLPEPREGDGNSVAGISRSPAVASALKAYDIIKKAVELQKSMIASGYNPESVEMENQIVAEAIKDWLKSEAGDWGEAMNLDYTPGEIAMQLLSGKDSDQNAKLLDVFAMHMQRELALAIVDGRGKGGAA